MLFPIMEGFDHYAAINGGVNGALDTEWNGVSATPSTLVVGLGGDGKAITWGAGAATGHMIKAFTADSKITFHFAIKVTINDADSQAEFIQFYAPDGGHQFGLWLTAAGRLSLRGEGALQVALSTGVLQLNQVYRVCCQADIAAGTFACSINGDVDAGLTQVGLDINDHPTVNTAGIIGNGMMASGFGSHNSYTIDDLIVGTGELVDWGPLEINTLPADSDIAAAWIRSAGANNFDNVNELPFNADTDYNSSSNVGDKDCFGFSNPPSTSASILAVSLMTLARKEESAVRKFREFLRIGGVDYNGTEHTLAETYGRWTSTWVLNPATGLAWTAAELLALQGGYEATVIA